MPQKIVFIDPAVADHPLTREIPARFGATEILPGTLSDIAAAIQSAPDPIGAAKHMLLLTRNPGAFLKPCPGTRNYTCCDYRILHIGSFCSLDCAYCILQAYFRPPIMQFFLNHDDLLAELKAHFNESRLSRIGTGEFTDSLIWDLWTDLSGILVPAFAAQDKSVLELKTKTVAVDRLQSLRHHRRTIVSWSLNTETVIQRQERSTASLTARLAAAKRCQEWGYPLAFHFDPMVIYEGCADAYAAVVDRLFRAVRPDNVVWISLGTFRFMPDLKAILERRFPSSDITSAGEFIPGLDGKMRYFKPQRIALFRRVVDAIRKRAPGVTVYFCMEDDEVWQRSMGFIPAQKGGLPAMLDDSVRRVCGVDQ